VNDADRAVTACSLLVLGVLGLVWVLDPWIWRRLTRREKARAVVDEAEQLVRDDHDRIAFQTITHPLEQEHRR
jgi:hypothetical protein